jgi:hypothetical protein
MRTVTIRFEDGGSHVYQNVPDEVTPDQVEQRAGGDFSGRRVVAIDGGRGQPRSAVDLIPGAEPGKPVPALPAQDAPGPSLADTAIGTGEAALTTLTGATGGALGVLGGTLKGLAEQILSGKFGTPEAARMVEQSAMQGAQALTYEPRTESGREQAAAVGETLQNILPVAAVAPALVPAGVMPRGTPGRVVAQAGAEGAARAVGGEAAVAGTASVINAASRVADMATKGATTLPRRALEALRQEPQKPTPGTMGSAGAAGTDVAARRIATAENLPVPIRLTKGQATRDPAQLKFEVETSKLPEEGVRLRERQVETNIAILQNIDHWIDQTGAEAPNLRAVGQAVDRALVEQVARDKTQIRAAYKAAEQAGEMEAPVTLANVVQHLNESAPDAAVTPLLDAARRRAIQLGIAAESDGQLVPQPVPLKTAELYRRAIGNATDYEPTNVRQSTIIKGLVDEATDGMGGDMYRQARKLRARYAQNYENRATVAKLLNTRKGTTDRQVAFEDVLDHAVLKGSLDDVRNVRRVLQRSGAEGQQAWRELQGGTLKWIKDEATKSVATDSTGNRVISPAALDKAIRTLDHDGRLEFVFGKKGAQQLRDINELAQLARTVPPEAGVNTSNTAATLLAAFGDILISGSTGTPAPVATASRLALKHIKDVKLRRRISDALNEVQKKQAPGKPPTPDESAERRHRPLRQ